MPAETKTDLEKLTQYKRLRGEYLNLSTLGYWTDARERVEQMIHNNCQDEALPELKRLLVDAQEKEEFASRPAFWRNLLSRVHGREAHQKQRFSGEVAN